MNVNVLANEIVIADLGPHGLLLARYVGEWRPHGALVLTWTIHLDGEHVDVIDGETRCSTKAPLDGLEACGWVKPQITPISDTCTELEFKVTAGTLCTSFRWRLNPQAKRLEQWLT